MNKRFVLGICILIFIIFLGIGIPKRVEGYVCDEGWYCDDSGTLGAGDWIKLYPWRCMKVENWWDFDCWGSDSDCHGESPVFYYSEPNCLNDIDPHQLGCCSPGSPPCTPSTSCSCSPLSSTETSYGSKTVTCSNGCGGTASSTCWCTGNCTPQSCPTGTTESNTGDYYDTYSCTNDCSVTQNRNCYCSICTPPTCPSFRYSDRNLGYGRVPLEKTPSCRNGQGASDNQTKCDITYRTCYCYSCLKQCPSPLVDTGSANLILNDFRECTNDCNVKPPENQDDCYETESPQPTEELTIVKYPQEYANHYGFSSITHTGDRQVETAWLGTLNDPFNPPITMVATYTDANGASDIEGLFVWFRGEQYTGELGTPIYISETAEPRASAKDSWGFMLRRIGSSWQPYVPSYNGGDVFWTKAHRDIIDDKMVFSIDGPSGGKMVEVTIIGNIIESGNTVSVKFSLRFSDNNGELFSDNVSEGLYKIYLMGLDKFSFTPYDNYNINYRDYWTPQFKYFGKTTLSPFWQPNQLRYKPEQNQLYARDWSYTEQTWTIDRTAPTLDTFEITVLENSITLSWEASDDRNLYAIVGNIFTSGKDEKTITVSTGKADVFLHDPITFSLNSENNGVDENKIGILNNMGVSLFQVGPNINGTEHSGSINLSINKNAQNYLYYYITVFDDAGNIAQSEEIKQDLNDWMVTSGGLAYSAGGTSFTAKKLASGAWDNVLPPSGYGSNPGLIPPDVNLTSEMWGETGGLINLNPHRPLRSYSLISNGIKLVEEDSYYTLLLDSYEKNKKNLGDRVKEIDISGDYSNLFGPVTNYCSDKEYCVFKSTGDVGIDSNFACNKKTLMFINGNLTINPPLKNSTDPDTLNSKNGCIFVVSDNVNISEGNDASDNNTSFKYDNVNGYILADGQIIIEDEYAKRDKTDPIIDGVYINGGLQSSKNDDKSILFNRYLRLEDRLKFPLLVIDLHPKYGILGEKFFGSKYIIQTIELGVKP